MLLAGLLMACGGGGDDASPADGSTQLPDELTDGGSRADADAPSDDGGSSNSADARVDDGGPPPVLVPRPMETTDFAWKTCADTLQCGTLHVPIDYDHPENGTLKLAIMRRLASGVRTGALFLNPGGPGASAIDFLGFFVQGSTSPLLDRFDLIAVDPRGIGGYGTSVSCHAKLQQLISADPSPDNDAEWQVLDDLYKAFADECAQADNAAILPFIGTPNVARDFDQVRAGLGEDKLDYLGFSYGTSIGAWYAELFPDHVGRLVLDGPVDLDLNAFDRNLTQSKGFELALGHYFDWCKVFAERCSWAMGGDPAQAFAAINAAVEAKPIPAATVDRPLGPGDFMVAVSTTMYGGTEGWRALSPALNKALDGDASLLMGFVDAYLARNMDGSYPNLQEMFFGVSCIDQAAPSAADVRAQAANFASQAPTFGVYGLTSMLACSYWPVQGQDRPAPTGKSAPPIVVLGSINDPATPYAWAQSFSKDLVSSLLLTSDLEGHTTYQRGDACIDAAVDAFLFDGVVPSGVTCTGALPKTLGAPVLPNDSYWARHRR